MFQDARIGAHLVDAGSWTRWGEVDVIIDGHSHWPLGRHPYDRLPATIEDVAVPAALIAAMDELGIAKVVTMAQRMERIRAQWLGSNPLATDLQARFPERFVAIAACEPVTRKGQFDRAGFEEVRALVQSGRVKGLLITPPYGHFALDDRRCYPFFQMASEHRVPIYIHQAAMYGPTENAPQFRAGLSTLDRVVVDFPDLKLNIEHLAWPWAEELLAIMAHAPNVYTDVAMLLGRPRTLAWHLTMAKDYGYLERVFWGTDFVGTSVDDYRAHVTREVGFVRRELNPILAASGWPELSGEEIDGLLADNVRRFLDL